MAQRLTPLAGLAHTLRHLSPRSTERQTSEETRLYYYRACIAATEERYDVALVFAAKALQIAPRDLATRLLVAQIHDRGQHDVQRAIKGYEKVISLAGYDGEDPYCAAARQALDLLVNAETSASLAPAVS